MVEAAPADAAAESAAAPAEDEAAPAVEGGDAAAAPAPAEGEDDVTPAAEAAEGEGAAAAAPAEGGEGAAEEPAAAAAEPSSEDATAAAAAAAIADMATALQNVGVAVETLATTSAMEEPPEAEVQAAKVGVRDAKMAVVVLAERAGKIDEEGVSAFTAMDADLEATTRAAAAVDGDEGNAAKEALAKVRSLPWPLRGYSVPGWMPATWPTVVLLFLSWSPNRTLLPAPRCTIALG